MSKKIVRMSFIFILTLGLAITTLAQRQTGSITGAVHDTEGTPLPGAAVTVSSASLMGNLSFVTSDTGTFRFPALPPGIYTLTIELPGFRKLNQEGLIVHVGRTTNVNIKLETATLEEEITVTAASPVVDVTSSKVAVNYTKDLLQNVPIGRDIYDVISSAPGVVSENVTYRRTFSSYGSSVRANQYALDGFSTDDPVTRYLASNINFDAFAEVEMEVAGHPAEVGMTDGAYINVVTKSGGNKFSGMSQVYYTGKSMVDTNFPEEQIATFSQMAPQTPAGEPNISPAKTISDLDASFQLGGPIIKDRVWFFGAFRYFDWEKNFTGFNDPTSGNPLDVTHKEWNAMLKLTLQLSSNHKIILNYNRMNVREPYYTNTVTAFALPDATSVWDNEHGDIAYSKWNWIISQNTFLDVRAGLVNRFFPLRLQPEAFFPIRDLGTGIASGCARFGETYTRGRYEAIISLTHFMDDFLGGNHEFKVGLDGEIAHGNWDTWYPAEYPHAAFYFISDGDYYWLGDNWGYIYPLVTGTKEGETVEENRMVRYSAYAQDSISLMDRLTLNLGVRFDHSYGVIPEQQVTPNPYWHDLMDGKFGTPDHYFEARTYPEMKDYFSWTSISPRIGITFDPFADGKTAIKAGYNRYYEYMMIQFTAHANPAYIHGAGYLWQDNNFNLIADEGDNFVLVYAREEDEEGNVKNPLDPDTSAPYVDEFTLGVEREIFPDFSVGVNYIYKQEKNILEDFDIGKDYSQTDVITEPGPDGSLGTSDDQQLTVYLGSDDLPDFWISNVQDLKRKYQAVEFVFNKKMSNRWQLLGSITISKNEGNISNAYGASWGRSGIYDNPNDRINDYGRLFFDRPLMIKLQGTFLAPFGINASFYYTHFSGTPWNRTIRIYGLDDSAGPFNLINAETSGSRRNPSRDNLDLRLEKTFTLGPGQLGVFVDVFNALNSGYINYYNGWQGRITYPSGEWRTNSRWLNEITGLTEPRVFKLSLRYSF